MWRSCSFTRYHTKRGSAAPLAHLSCQIKQNWWHRTQKPLSLFQGLQPQPELLAPMTQRLDYPQKPAPGHGSPRPAGQARPHRARALHPPSLQPGRWAAPLPPAGPRRPLPRVRVLTSAYRPGPSRALRSAPPGRAQPAPPRPSPVARQRPPTVNTAMHVTWRAAHRPDDARRGGGISPRLTSPRSTPAAPINNRRCRAGALWRGAGRGGGERRVTAGAAPAPPAVPSASIFIPLFQVPAPPLAAPREDAVTPPASRNGDARPGSGAGGGGRGNARGASLP